jgi:hypothetical protein
MTPFQYLARYHSLPVIDSRLGINAIADIRNYRPLKSKEEKEDDKKKGKDGPWTMPAQWNNEHGRLLGKIAQGLKLRPGQGIPNVFTLDDKKIGPSQVFYLGSIRRAYHGRASPDDMIDTVRLAVWADLATPAQAAQYMQKWFGQDCNAFVSNYLGIAPYFSIAAYAHGYGNAPKISGATSDVYAARATVPLKPRTEFSEIQTGDVIATFGDADFAGNRWRHIALVESWTLEKWNDNDAYGIISIAEWGNQGGLDSHRSIGKPINVRRGKLCPELNKMVIAFPSGLYGEGAIRIFLNATPLDKYDNRGFHIADSEGL